jgi:hypothetical protein
LYQGTIHWGKTFEIGIANGVNWRDSCHCSLFVSKAAFLTNGSGISPEKVSIIKLGQMKIQTK